MVEPIKIPVHEETDAVARWVWKNLVPTSGQSAWVQGELLRCVEKLCWEARNNGNGNWDLGFERLATDLERTLCSEPDFSDAARQQIRNDVAIIRNYMYPYTDQDLYDRLTEQVVAFCRLHPLPIPKPHDPQLHR